MISKPATWDSISENSVRRLPMGAYVCIIRKVTDFPDDQYLNVEYDVVEGEYKGIGVDTYEKWGKWNHSFRAYYTEKSMWRFKRFISRVEQTNPNFTFDWNPQSLINKGIGLIIGIRQGWGKDGSLREYLDVQDFCTATDVREDNLPSEPKVREPNTPPPVAKVEEVATVDLDDNLPF